MRSASINVVILAALLAGCSKPPDKATTPIAIADIAGAYPSYHRMTDQEVLVNPELAAMCAPPVSREMVEALRTKHGPHANTGILIYMNEPAAKAFSNGSAVYPEGAVIVKRKRISNYIDVESGKSGRRAENGAGGMVKRAAGFDPSHGDWEYFYFDDVSKIQTGRIESCIRCHEGAKDKDYVFGTWRTAPATAAASANR